jgi:hypothetical protein
MLVKARIGPNLEAVITDTKHGFLTWMAALTGALGCSTRHFAGKRYSAPKMELAKSRIDQRHAESAGRTVTVRKDAIAIA